MAVLPLGREEEGWVGGGIGAAELYLLGVVEGEVGVHGPARAGRVRIGASVAVMVVMEGDEVSDGFPGELAALEEEVEIHHELVLAETLT